MTETGTKLPEDLRKAMNETSKKEFDIKSGEIPNRTTQTMTAKEAVDQAENGLVGETGLISTKTAKIPKKPREIVSYPETGNLRKATNEEQDIIDADKIKKERQELINYKKELVDQNTEFAKELAELLNQQKVLEANPSKKHQSKEFQEAIGNLKTRIQELRRLISERNKLIEATNEKIDELPESKNEQMNKKDRQAIEDMRDDLEKRMKDGGPGSVAALKKFHEDALKSLAEDDKIISEKNKIEATKTQEDNEKAKQEKLNDPKIKDLQEEIKQLQQIIEEDGKKPEKEKRNPIEMKVFQDALVDKQNKLKETKELFVDGEISPETKTKEKVISEVALMAVNPQNNKNMLENNHIMSYTKGEIKDILEKEKDPKTALKKYLIDSLDSAISLRNEAKYGAGFMGKLKKFFNEGWGGALAKTGFGAGLIGAGLYSGIGLFSPMIYGAGLRLAFEGATQLGQEINDAFNKKSRKHLLENGRVRLEQMVNEKIEEIAKNPELNTDQKRTQATMEFIDQIYAQEVKNLVEQDTDHLRRAEKLRRHMGWVGAAAGILVGMPMDIDLDGVSHFVGLKQNLWYDAAGKGHSLLHHLGTSGAFGSLASYGIGSAVSYIFNRGTEGDEHKFKLDIRTTKEQQEVIEKDHINKGTTPEEKAAADEKNEQDQRRKDKVKAVSEAENIAEGGKEKEKSSERKKLLLLLTELQTLNKDQLKEKVLLNPEEVPTEKQSDTANFAYLILLSKNLEQINKDEFKKFDEKMRENYCQKDDALKTTIETLLNKIKPVENEENKVAENAEEGAGELEKKQKLTMDNLPEEYRAVGINEDDLKILNNRNYGNPKIIKSELAWVSQLLKKDDERSTRILKNVFGNELLEKLKTLIENRKSQSVSI